MNKTKWLQVVAKAPWSPFMLFEIKGDAVHLRPIPLTFLCGYAAPVHGKTSLSVNTMLGASTQLCFGFWSPFYLGWVAVQYKSPWPCPLVLSRQSSGSMVQIFVWPILMHEISAANMDHFLVLIQDKGQLFSLDAIFPQLFSGLFVFLNFNGCSKKQMLSVMLIMPNHILSCIVLNELGLGGYVSIFESSGMSLWPSWVQGVKQHQPWPTPDELRSKSCDAELQPTPWPSFNLVERCSVRCY